MGKNITVHDKYDNSYKLEFTRDTAKATEKAGFDLEKIDAMPMNMVDTLVRGAFLANHKNTKVETIDEIYNAINGKEAFLAKLVEMYADTANTLLDEGNAEWEANF